MNTTPHPLILEINTRCWLNELRTQSSKKITLANIPPEIFQHWADLGFTHIWLMGVWSTGKKSRNHALHHPQLKTALNQALPNWSATDIAGSPYAPENYTPAPSLGGFPALTKFRQHLHSHGLQLILDFIPNHTGLDHPWITQHPERFVQSPQPNPETFTIKTPGGPVHIAHGKDPNFPAWTDTAQLDLRRPDTRQAITKSLESVAKHCDGLRCDMTMLLLNKVFLQTWRHLPPSTPPAKGEFWTKAIQQLRKTYPDFLLLAEAYWNLEPRLQKIGFNFTYDKTLYDHFIQRNTPAIRKHLGHSTHDFISRSAHFLENHDEPPIATLLTPAEHQAATLATLALPGLRLIHETQLQGYTTQIPVQLQRRPSPPPNPEIASLYQSLLHALKNSFVGSGAFSLLPTQPAWPDNHSHENFLALQWSTPTNPSFSLAVVNLAPTHSQCYTPLSIPCLSDHNWLMTNLLGPEQYLRTGEDLQTRGLYLDTPPHAAQLFQFTPHD
ncbi:MAG: hypothetical protein RI897_2261 [Verrucomicrobiota bacterium]|jgi:hypothetical protein